ncbi:LysR family transcriptional regulator [Acidihalobacter prosperus]|uniref:LysR family transcriptional regulator n=1 Tax=Acidihalobacter prosperus TaxID=160660 RepID=A0A1A6C3L2_9GAMM|nr:LysR family transcriptional regulator [Acidihalobacter prosperus]OBS09148.1 LysR family transcriptional regulator [Acidihalobacter prosperus]
MRLTLDALNVLDAIERKGSFAAAAEALHRVPSAVTYTVQKLEQDLDVTLFDRSGHRARLTEAGRKLVVEGRHLLRMADDLESLVKRVSTGWETELRIAVSDLIPISRLYPVLEEFYAAGHGTRLRLSEETFGGNWDALMSGRADLVAGAPGDGPPEGGYNVQPLGEVEFVFAVAPHHPLARAAEPIPESLIRSHRVIVAADSSRHLPPRSSGIAGTQAILTLPSMEAKREAQCRGLGIGYLPRHLIARDLASGRLLTRQVAADVPKPRLSLAWRGNAEGRALAWFLERLSHRDWLEGIIG